MKRTLILTLSLALALPFTPAKAVNGFGVGDITKAAIYALGPCESAASLDCIQSIEVRDEALVWRPLTFDSFGSLNRFTDHNGNDISQGATIWKSDTRTVSVSAGLETPEHIIFSSGSSGPLRGAALRIEVSTSDLLNTFIRVKFRTSWLKPQNVQFKINNSDYSVTPIPGGNLWSVEGNGLQYSDYEGDLQSDAKKRFTAQADVERTFFTLYLHHADSRSGYGYWPGTCGEVGYSVQSNNTNATGEPTWDSRSNTLQFSIYAPHLTSKGEVNKGYFKLWVSDKFLDCKFPKNTLSKAASITLQVVDENGQSQVATTTLQHKNGAIHVFAYGFHFSQPKIVLTAVKTTIKCTKGKLMRMITDITPICPKGFSRRQ